MKICFLADAQSVHTIRWCNHFSSAGHETHLISFRPGIIQNTIVHYLPAGNLSVHGGNWRTLLTYSKIKQLLLFIKPDILHAHYATSYGMAGALSGFHPFIVTCLGTDILISPQKSILYNLLIRFVFKKADFITVMADHMTPSVLKYGASIDKVKTVIFGIDPVIFNRKDRKLPERNFVITSTRNFEAVYNLDLLIDALSIVKDKIPGLIVNLIGDGSMKTYLMDKVSKLKMDHFVQFYGKVPPSKIAEILNKTHLFVTTSLSDGNNISLNEAMACGTVVLGTDIPANHQWIKQGINGFLVPLHNAEYLAEKIMYVYTHFNEMQGNATTLNDSVINQYALWNKNMEVVENMYSDLIMKHEK